MAKCECGVEILERLGYTDKCHYCMRKEVMALPDKEIADELTKDILIHKKDWYFKEAVRRILLGLDKNPTIKGLEPHEIGMFRVLLKVLTGGNPENDLEEAFIKTVLMVLKSKLGD
jgi:hypothetical protein